MSKRSIIIEKEELQSILSASFITYHSNFYYASLFVACAINGIITPKPINTRGVMIFAIN